MTFNGLYANEADREQWARAESDRGARNKPMKGRKLDSALVITAHDRAAHDSVLFFVARVRNEERPRSLGPAVSAAAHLDANW